MKKVLATMLLYSFTYLFPEVSLAQQDITPIIQNMEYRFLGPYRGGRATAVSGIPSQPYVFLMGTTGGGVWKTDDAGNTWDNLSDGQIKCGSIGSISIHPIFHDIIYVGTGSDSPRGNVSAGIGIYKSEDGGKTWIHKGLDQAGQIGDVVFHPIDPDIAYVAALGNIFGPNPERGVYKTHDGGDNWEQVLYLDDTTGAIDLAIHSENPNVVFAGMWRVERKPWTLIDGGLSGGLYKTTNAGKKWKKVDGGLPQGLIGKIGISISPADPDILYVIQQTAEETSGGVYKSEDGGQSFDRINDHHKLRQRGWYYSRIFADPVDKNKVYVTNTGFYRSIDGGKTFDQRLPVPHGDCHDVWINPLHPDIMINSNDGGATVTLNGGRTWSTPYNQPTAELYRISTDNRFPFRVYAGQQDNSTISVPIRNRGGIHPKQHWLEVGGGESADVAVVPSNPNIVYATTYSGIITRVNLKTGEKRQVGAYPHYTEGTEQRNLKYRWQWNFPIRVSLHDENIIYHTSNYVHKSTDEGSSWQIISKDLSRNINAYQGIPGGPIQHDATGVEVYSTVFSFAESPFDAQELWAGSDDGLLHHTMDAGLSWKEVTPKDMPYEGTINHIELSVHDHQTAFIVIYNYRYADFTPYIFKTTNQGKSWQKITQGIDEHHFVRSFVQDPVNPDLLFAGTEYGMYVSLNGGNQWHPFQNNLPHTPITDMEIKDHTLVMSTQGRGFWSMDDINLLRRWSEGDRKKSFNLYPITNTYKSNLGSGGGRMSPPAARYQVNYTIWVQDTSQSISAKILNTEGKEIFERSHEKLELGINTFSWDMTLKPPFMVEDLTLMDMKHPGQGPAIPPGTYTLNTKQGDMTQEQPFQVKLDPNWESSDPDYAAQFKLAQEVAQLVDQSQRELKHLRDLEINLQALTERELDPGLKIEVDKLAKQSKKLQDLIYQDKIKTTQDEINFERLFTNHLIRLYRVVLSQHGAPTGGELERWQDVQAEYQPFKKAYSEFINTGIKGLNAKLKAKQIDFLGEKPD